MGKCLACAAGLGLYKRTLAAPHAAERAKLQIIEFDFHMNYGPVIM